MDKEAPAWLAPMGLKIFENRLFLIDLKKLHFVDKIIQKVSLKERASIKFDDVLR